MLGIASWFLSSRIGRVLGAAVAFLLAVVTFGALERRKGRKQAEIDNLKDSVKREKSGRDAVAKEQTDAKGLSNSDIIDRMRGRKH